MDQVIREIAASLDEAVRCYLLLLLAVVCGVGAGLWIGVRRVLRRSESVEASTAIGWGSAGSTVGAAIALLF